MAIPEIEQGFRYTPAIFNILLLVFILLAIFFMILAIMGATNVFDSGTLGNFLNNKWGVQLILGLLFAALSSLISLLKMI